MILAVLQIPICAVSLVLSSTDGVPTSLVDEGKEQYRWERQSSWITKLSETNLHLLMPSGGLRPIGTEESIPPGEVEPIINVNLMRS